MLLRVDYILSQTEHNTMKIIENLKNKTSTGVDGISNQLLKLAKKCFGKTYYYIIHQVIVTGTFPDNLTIAKVIPL